MSLATTARPNANGNLFEIRTVQSAAFRTLIEALKEILTEANLEFDSTGIRVIDVDETHTVLTYLRLHADRFEYFYCPAKFVLGINMIYLFTNVENIEFPNISFTSIINMPSADFQKICRDFNALAEMLEITSSNNDLIFRCVGDFVDGETIIMSNNQGGIEIERNTTEIVQGMFELKYLVLFTKCTNLCASTQIHLKNDYPLVLRYMVANLGEVRLVLAPKKQKTETSGRPQKV